MSCFAVSVSMAGSILVGSRLSIFKFSLQIIIIYGYSAGYLALDCCILILLFHFFLRILIAEDISEFFLI